VSGLPQTERIDSGDGVKDEKMEPDADPGQVRVSLQSRGVAEGWG